MIASLKEFIQPYKSQRFGFSVEDAQRVTWDVNLRKVVFNAIEGGEQAEVLLALMLSEGCWKNDSLSKAELLELVQKIWKRIPQAAPRLASSLIRTIRILLPDFASEHTEEIGKLIESENPLVRLESVQLIKEAGLVSLYPNLSSLKDDSYAAEVNMDGRHEFIIRNEAFEILSNHVGNRKKKELNAVVEGGITSYFWDWKPLLKKL